MCARGLPCLRGNNIPSPYGVSLYHHWHSTKSRQNLCGRFWVPLKRQWLLGYRYAACFLHPTYLLAAPPHRWSILHSSTFHLTCRLHAPPHSCAIVFKVKHFFSLLQTD